MRFLPALILAAAGLAACEVTAPWSAERKPNSGPRAPLADPLIQQAQPFLAVRNQPVYLTLQGSGFGAPAETEALAPTLTLERTRDLDGNPVDGPAASAKAPAYLDGSGLEVITGPLAFDDTAPFGVYRARVTNRDGRSGAFEDLLVLLPVPEITGLEERAACRAVPGSRIAVAGSDFLSIGGNAGRISVAQPGFPATELSTSAQGCRDIPFARAALQRCSRLLAPLPGTAGIHTVTIAPRGPGAVSASLPFLVDAPEVWPSPGKPLSVADGQQQLFLTTWGYVPHGAPGAGATLDGAPVAIAAGACSASAVDGWDVCTGLAAVVPQATPAGLHQVAVEHLAGCSKTVAFTVRDRPTVSGITPAQTCSRGGEVLRVAGTGFLQLTQVFLGDREISAASCTPLEVCDSIPATLPAAIDLAPGVYPLSVQIDTSPPARSLDAVELRVLPGPPSMGDPTPHTFHTGAGKQIVVPILEPATTLTAAVLLASPDAVPISVPFVQGTASAVLTAPDLPAGTGYRVLLTEGASCTGTAPFPVRVVDRVRITSNEGAVGAIGTTWFGDPRGHSPAPPGTPVLSQQTTGNPGPSIAGTSDGSLPAPWYFSEIGWPGWDVGVIRLDLARADPATGAAIDAPDIILRTFDGWLERSLEPAPTAAWTHYDLDLDDPTGWTYRDVGGSRPATAAELRRASTDVHLLMIRGQYADGPSDTRLDNLTWELRP